MIFGHTKWPDSFFLEGDKPLDIKVRVHPRARHYRLTLSGNGEPILSVPPKGKVKDAEAFLQRQKNWLTIRLERRPPSVPFIEGAIIPLRGEDHEIIGTGKVRGVVFINQPDHTQGQKPENSFAQIHVPGGANHMGRRLRDWLKTQALADLEVRSSIHGARLGVCANTISIRGQSGRWGSCSSAGRLNYNWRLILAPPFVLDYVAAHEVAHLCEMNHSEAFWARVKETLPDMERGRSWLKTNGNRLMSYGN